MGEGDSPLPHSLSSEQCIWHSHGGSLSGGSWACPSQPLHSMMVTIPCLRHIEYFGTSVWCCLPLDSGQFLHSHAENQFRVGSQAYGSALVGGQAWDMFDYSNPCRPDTALNMENE